MKKTLALTAALAAVLTFGAAAPAAARGLASGPAPRHAEFGEPYLFGHLGLFGPKGDLNNYDTGNNFDVGFGSRVNGNIAIEASVGRFAAKSPTGTLTVLPLTFGGRLILPQDVVEPYAGLGLGFYRVNLDDSAPPPAGLGVNDSDTTVGGYLSLGADAWLNPRTALNFEGRYQIVNPSLGTQNIEVGGWTLSLGLRVGF
jgi:hypothetical protein